MSAKCASDNHMFRLVDGGSYIMKLNGPGDIPPEERKLYVFCEKCGEVRKLDLPKD